MTTAFQSGAFQTNGFQIAAAAITGALAVTEASDALSAAGTVGSASVISGGGSGGGGGGGGGGFSYRPPTPSYRPPVHIQIKSEAQRQMLKRVAQDPAEARRRGMTVEQARAALDGDHGGRLPHRLGPVRPNRHRGRS